MTASTSSVTLVRHCASCGRSTKHEELTGDRGRQLPDRRVIVCDNCGLVGVEPR